jgi:hypothetical protein
MSNVALPTLGELRQLAAVQPALHFCFQQYDEHELTLEQTLMLAVAILHEQVSTLQVTLQNYTDRAPEPSQLYLERGR